MGRLASARVPPSYPMRAALTRDLLRRSTPVVRSARHPVRVGARHRCRDRGQRIRHPLDGVLGFVDGLVSRFGDTKTRFVANSQCDDAAHTRGATDPEDFARSGIKQIPGPETTGRRWFGAIGRWWTERIAQRSARADQRLSLVDIVLHTAGFSFEGTGRSFREGVLSGICDDSGTFASIHSAQRAV